MPDLDGPRTLTRLLRLTWLVAALLIAGSDFLSGPLSAAEPDLKAVFPSACQRGESIDVTLVGDGLDTSSTLHFTGEGLTAKHVEKNLYRVSVADEAALGDCDVWVATAEGLAGPRRFSVIACPVVTETESNDTNATAQQIPLPSAVNARLDKSADMDWFAFDAHQDQSIVVTARSLSLDGSVQPSFTLVAPDGRELVHSSSQRSEPQIAIQLPAAGSYQLLVHDRAYRQDEFSFYRIELATGPNLRSTSRNFAGLISRDDLFDSAIEEDSKQSRDSPQAVTLPCRVAGRFNERNDVDWFRFQAKKDQAVYIEAFGERLGQLMDLEVTVHDAADKQVASASDTAVPKGIPATLPLGTLDPTVAWKVPADGEYAIAIRDLYGGSVFGPDRVYELIVELQQPRFYVIAMPAHSKTSRGTVVKRGGEAELSLFVVRSGRFAGTVTVSADESPPGLTVDPCVLDSKEVTKAIKVSAAQDAPIGFHSLRLVAEAEIDSDKQSDSEKKRMVVWPATQVRAGVTRRSDGIVIYVGE